MELSEYKLKMEKKRRAHIQALAIIKRAKESGIPNKYLRIGPKKFLSILDTNYHKNAPDFVNHLWTQPAKSLFSKNFIIIDGGDIYSRKTAAFALLFRMIACDKRGKYYECSQLATEFQSIRNIQFNRNDLAREVREQQLLLLGEFSTNKFNEHFESGNFFDQVLEYRDDYSKPTIITFKKPLPNSVTNQINAIRDDRCGSYLAMLSQSDIKRYDHVLRIKVK